MYKHWRMHCKQTQHEIKQQSVRTNTHDWQINSENGPYVCTTNSFIQLQVFIDPDIVLSIFMLSFSFVIVCYLFAWKRICDVFLFLFLFFIIYVLLLEIHLSKVKGWDPVNRFNSAIFLCLWLSQVKIWISNVICRGLK